MFSKTLLPYSFLLFFAVFLSSLSPLSAQEVGAFQEVVEFSEPDYMETRILYYFVPQDYDPNQKYKLVLGFRGGPHSNAGQFRDQLTFLADSIGAIILCPENSAHFPNDEGQTKRLFTHSVARVMSNYNIDPDFIYLTGLSYGGRHAVIVSMNTSNGPISKVRGVIPFAAGINSEAFPDYGSIADFPPACICIGDNDSQNFRNVSNTLHNDIQANGGVSLLNTIEGVGHTVAFSTYPAEMMECIQFIEDQYESVSVFNAPEQVMMKVYPNPASKQIRLTFEDQRQAEEIFLMDHLGNRVMNIAVEDKEVLLSSMPAGTYWVVARLGNQWARTMLVLMP